MPLDIKLPSEPPPSLARLNGSGDVTTATQPTVQPGIIAAHHGLRPPPPPPRPRPSAPQPDHARAVVSRGSGAEQCAPVAEQPQHTAVVPPLETAAMGGVLRPPPAPPRHPPPAHTAVADVSMHNRNAGASAAAPPISSPRPPPQASAAVPSDMTHSAGTGPPATRPPLPVPRARVISEISAPPQLTRMPARGVNASTAASESATVSGSDDPPGATKQLPPALLAKLKKRGVVAAGHEALQDHQPAAHRAAAAAPPLPDELPAGWQEAVDPTYQHPYWFNVATGERSWVKPGSQPVSAPAPVASVAPSAAQSLPAGALMQPARQRLSRPSALVQTPAGLT